MAMLVHEFVRLVAVQPDMLNIHAGM